MTKGKESDWKTLIKKAAGQRPPPLVATRHDGGLTTASKPQRFECEGPELYIVKFRGNLHGDGKAIFNEQVVALAGSLIGAPVPPVQVIEVSQHLVDGLIANRAALSLDFDPDAGAHHGSRSVGRDVTDRLGLQYEQENRERFGALDVLYSWVPYTGDHQWIYETQSPHRVFSVDHTPLFPGGSDWTASGLAAAVNDVAFDQQLATLKLNAQEREPAATKLASVSDHEIAEIVARPPDAWGVGLADRCAVASYLATRRDGVVALCGA